MNDDLVNESKNGNKEAFTELILRHQKELYRIAKMRLADDYDIDDAIQETMITAFKSIKKLKENKYFRTWIIKILINKCNEIYSKKKKESNIAKKYDVTSFETKNEMLEIENKFDFYRLINILNYKERISMVLHYVYDYKIKDISEILDTSENTIKARLARGREKIKSKGGIKNG